MNFFAFKTKEPSDIRGCLIILESKERDTHCLFRVSGSVSASAVVSDEGVRLFFCPCWMDNEEKVNELEAQLTSQLGG